LRGKRFFPLVAVAAILIAGCPRANEDFQAGRKAEAIQDYDTALVHYERALRTDPANAEYKLREMHMRFEAGTFHVEQGEKALKRDDLQTALAEFEKAEAIDPSNAAADQEIKHTMNLLAAKNAAEAPNTVNPTPPEDENLLSVPPELKPLSREPKNLKMTNESRVVFETIAKLAGLSVLFDPEFVSKRITVELPNVTLEQALDAVALESKAFWKPLTSSVIFVAPDNPNKRKDLEDELVQTFYLKNTVQTTDVTEIVSGLRQIFGLTKIQQVNAQNAIIVRDTPDKLLLVGKFIRDLDKPRAEVLLHVQVLTASRDRLRDLGILPGQSVGVAFNPRTALQPTSSSTSSTSSTSTSTSPLQVTLNNLQHLASADWSITLPGAQANAILTDNKTRLIQDPEVRVSDGQKATLTIGEKVPIATGSFQAGIGVSSSSVSPLVNTQFTYQDVGVKIDVQQLRVHPEGDVSMKLSIEVSALNGSETIGGISQPIISSRKIEHDIRLTDGETNILGGLIEHTDTFNLNGIPGAAQLPMLKYLFSNNSKEVEEDEVLIFLTPHIIRMPSISAENLRTLASGTENNVRVYREDEEAEPAPAGPSNSAAPPAIAQPNPAASPQLAAPAAPKLHFDPASITMKQGDTTTIGLAISDVNDLYSIPLLIHYKSAAVQVQEVRDGGFLSGGTQEIAIVQRIDEQRGEIIVSATRQPNTPGVNGTGTLFGIVVRAIAPGTSTLQILQVNAHDSQQRTIPMVSGEATIRVQ
jgi:general secretion pathway protein D